MGKKKDAHLDDPDLDDVSSLEDAAAEKLQDTPDKHERETDGDPTSAEAQSAAVTEAVANKSGVPAARHPKPTAYAGLVEPPLFAEYRLLPGKKHILTQEVKDADGNPTRENVYMKPGDTCTLNARQAQAFADKFERV